MEQYTLKALIILLAEEGYINEEELNLLAIELAEEEEGEIYV